MYSSTKSDSPSAWLILTWIANVTLAISGIVINQRQAAIAIRVKPDNREQNVRSVLI